MARRRYELTDHEWLIIEPLLPNKPRGVPRVDDRRVLNGILWRFRTGSPWAEVPERYGPSTTCYNRFVRWRRAGVWDRLLEEISKVYDGDIIMIDSTCGLGPHQQAMEFLAPAMRAVDPGIDCLGAHPVLCLLQLEPAGDLLRALFHSKCIQDAGYQLAQALDLRQAPLAGQSHSFGRGRLVSRRRKAVSLKFPADRRGRPPHQAADGATRFTVCMQTVNLASLVKADVIISLSHTSARDLFALISADRTRVLGSGKTSVAAVRLFEALPRHPVVTVASAMALIDTSKPTAIRSIEALVGAGILVETTGKKRDRSFAYQGYVNRLRVGTELER